MPVSEILVFVNVSAGECHNFVSGILLVNTGVCRVAFADVSIWNSSICKYWCLESGILKCSIRNSGISKYWCLEPVFVEILTFGR